MTPPEPRALGDLIKGERLAQGLSYGQLAELLGVSKSLVYRWENSNLVPKVKHLSALARVLELPTARLMRLSGAESPHDAPGLPAMLRAEYDLPPEAVARIEAYVARVARQYQRGTDEAPRHDETQTDQQSNQPINERGTP